MKVYLSKLAESKLLKLTEYLLEEWIVEVRDEFISKLTEKINQISSHPKSCSQSNNFKGLFKCVVSKQTTFYYRIHNKKQKTRNRNHNIFRFKTSTEKTKCGTKISTKRLTKTCLLLNTIG